MTAQTSPAPGPRLSEQLATPAGQAFALLRAGFTVAPIVFGLDKFAEVMVDWSTYLWSGVDTVVPGTADEAMLVVGAVEILAGLVVAFRPRFGGYLVAAWLGVIILNLLLAGGFLDIALRDLGLLLGALALARLAAGTDGGAARSAPSPGD